MILRRDGKIGCVPYFIVIAVFITYFCYFMNNMSEQTLRSLSTGTDGLYLLYFYIMILRRDGKIGCVPYFIVIAVFITYFCYFMNNMSEQTLRSLSTGTDGRQSTEFDTVEKLQERRRLPHCLIIGVKKAGTLALLKFLNIHPDIVIPKSNEIHFFDSDELYEKGLDYYKSKMPFSKPQQITVEKTPAYFHTWTVPERVHQMNSSVKLLLLMRDPVERIISEYDMMSDKKGRKGVVYPYFKSLVLNEQGDVNTKYIAVNISTYWAHFSRWLEYFPIRQIHLIDGKSFAKNPHKELYAIEQFLGLKHFISDENLVFVKSKRFFCPVINGNEPECLPKGKGRKHPDRNPNILNKLKKYFQPLNEKFFELSSTRFDWS